VTAESPFRLTVLNPGGRDPAQDFRDGADAPGAGHQPTNFHGYAACTRGSFHSETARAVAEKTPVLLLLRGDFRAAERALDALQTAGRKVAVSLKETGLHQIANQLRDSGRLVRFVAILRRANTCLGATPEAADFYRSLGDAAQAVAFIPTPYPLQESVWNFSRPIEERSGIFIGTREFDVLSRNHLAALSLARRLSAQTGEPITVYNLDGRQGRRLLDALGFAAGRLRILERKVSYHDYLREIAAHKIVLQLDTSFVPGQVAGDACLARVPCVGGNGAIDRLAFPELCGDGRSIREITSLAERLLTDREFYGQEARKIDSHAARIISFEPIADDLRAFFGRL
ncbi:MAG: hypothetical protein M3Z64_06985, partial [Verrucomicrobiota bacterium]|nr:hypothetical protein [Verrucomicrobiota bacterium]